MKRRLEKSSTYSLLAEMGNNDGNTQPNKKSLKQLQLKSCENLFGQTTTPPIFVGSKAIHRKFIDGTYRIYSKNTVSELLDQGKRKLRILLSKEFQLLFAEEGVPNGSIPHHSRMTGAKTQLEAECTAAGNVKFNDNKEIIKITHKSGDFEPSFDSLRWVLGAMFANDLEFADEVQFNRLDSSGGVIEKFLVSSEELMKIILDSFPENILKRFKDVNENLGTAIHQYQDPARANHFNAIRAARAPGRRLNFVKDEEPLELNPSVNAALI